MTDGGQVSGSWFGLLLDREIILTMRNLLGLLIREREIDVGKYLTLMTLWCLILPLLLIVTVQYKTFRKKGVSYGISFVFPSNTTSHSKSVGGSQDKQSLIRLLLPSLGYGQVVPACSTYGKLRPLDTWC